MKVVLNTLIDYRDGYINAIDSLPEPEEVDPKYVNIVERDCKGWGESNAVVVCGVSYYLATVTE